MNSLSDQQLLRDYAESRSEAAFAELVRRHLDLVYSAALRMLHDAHLAEDVAQGAFVALARNARQLTDRPALSGWLHGTARNLAAKVVRTDARRRAREQEAVAMNKLLAAEPGVSWEEIAPHLDAALGELNEPDRDALLLRYFEHKSAREMAATLGLSDEAAQKRVSRAVERLRELFAKRGVTIGASGLVVVVSANAVQAAPVGLAATLSSVAFGSAATGSATLALLKLMATSKLKVGVISTIIAASAVTSLVIHHASQANIRKVGGRWQRQAAQLSELESEKERLSNLIVLANGPSANNQDELQRLRGEILALRMQTNELAALLEQRRQLRASLGVARQRTDGLVSQPAGLIVEAQARVEYCKDLGLAIMEYAAGHQNRFPTNFDQAAALVSARTRKETNFATGQFEIVYHGSRTALAKYAQPGAILLIREKQPWKTAGGHWAKVYVFCDGGGTALSAADGNFEAWEKQHMLPADPSNP